METEIPIALFEAPIHTVYSKQQFYNSLESYVL